MRVIRAFIAIEMSPEIKSGLETVSAQLKDQLISLPLKWMAVDNIHLTLKFLGDVSVANLEGLKSMLRSEAGKYQPFEFHVGELGVFPSLRRPRVIWVGVQAPDVLFNLQKGIEAGAAHLGYPREERGFSPHLTLGRVSRTASSEELGRIGESIGKSRVASLGAKLVQSLNLYQSDLQPGGTVYTCLFTANLS